MAHRTKIIVIVLALAVVVCGAGGWFVFSQAKNTIFAMSNEAQIEGDDLMERLGKTWTEEDLQYFASADFLVMTEEDQRRSWLKKMKEKLGSFKQGTGSIQGQIKVVKDLGGEDAFGAVYENTAEFEKAKVKVQIQLIKRIRTGGWQMASLTVLNEQGEPDAQYAPDAPPVAGGGEKKSADGADKAGS